MAELADSMRRRVEERTERVSLVSRVAVLTTLAVALTLGAVSALIYFFVRAEMINNLDESIRNRANAALEAGYSPASISSNDAELLDVAGIAIYRVSGNQLFSYLTGTNTIRPSQDEIEVSRGNAEHSARTAVIDGAHYRVVAVGAGEGSAMVMVQPMDSAQDTLDRLGLILLLTSLGGVVLAGVAGWAVAANGLRPVRRLTRAAEHVARTSELTPIAVTGHDELARLTLAFNKMLTGLAASQHQQRQLVADAGHELRTPLTSLRTNIELLALSDSSGRQLAAGQREELLADVSAQIDELSTLVGDLVDLARDEPLQHDLEPLDLSDVVRAALERVRLRATDLEFVVALDTWIVEGEQRTLERAITNLLDNAVKWSPDGGTVTVVLHDGVLSVGDRGPGISAEDLPHVFERFYRSSEARTLPGSGLGLSIVARAAELHGGSVSIDSELGQGSTFHLRIPGEPGETGTFHTGVSEPSQ